MELTKTQDEIEAIREQDRFKETKAILRVIANRMAMPLYMLFWVADILYVPHLKWEFLAVRSLIIPNCFLVLWLTKKAKNFLHIQWVASYFVITLALAINYMIFRIDIAETPYYAGLNLVALGSLSFIPWKRYAFLLVTGLVFGPFYLITLLQANNSDSLKGIAINSFFIGSTILILFLIRFFNERLRVKELNTRLELHGEIASRNKIIEEKTKQAIQLTELSRQFSPQIVEAIKEGRVTLQNEIHRSELCAMFVDIVNSTERLNRIDKDDFQRVMAEFMDDAMKVMLKYDITIDKFLGDGILSFSNDPIKHHDYVERVVSAALEIQQRIRDKQSFYEEFWLAEFQVRIGISKGFASVGFYGSKRYFHSYTALGPVVNMASRICDVAEPGEVLVSNKVKAALGKEDDILFEVRGKYNLKGFENDIIKLYKASYKDSASKAKGELDCPECDDGILYVDQDTKGIYILKCRSCGHICEDEEMEFQKRAS